MAGQDRPPRSVHLLDVVGTAVSEHPALQLRQRDVAISEALELQAAGQFNSVIEAGWDRRRVYTPLSQPGLTRLSLAPSNSAQGGASYSRLLRSGIELGGSVDLSRAIGSGGPGTGITTSRTVIQVVAPLLQGRGRDVTTSDERAARLGRDAAVFDVSHSAATVMANVVSSYWGLVAAQRLRAVAAASTDRGRVLIENMRAMIAADQVPASDVTSALANLADRETGLVAAEQGYVDARQRLLIDMGVRVDSLGVDVALDEFPGAVATPTGDALSSDIEGFIAQALARRADYAAAGRDIEAARIRRGAAANGLLPDISVTAQVGYSGLAQGGAFGNYLWGLGASLRGADVVGGFSYRFPVQNGVATGRLMQADAQLQQALLRAEDIARAIRFNVTAAHSALRNALSRVEKARRSVEAFRDALQGERDKLALGVGAIVNVLTIEDRLTSASEREVIAWRDYAQALVRFRFEAGLLDRPTGSRTPLNVEMFTRVPDPPGKEG